MIAWKTETLDRTIASVRFRCLNPLRKMREHGFPVTLFEPADVDAYGAVVFCKVYDLAHQDLARRLRERGRAVVFDLCDNHFCNPNGLPNYERARRDLLAMVALSDLVVCSTETLAEIVRDEAGLAYEPPVVGDAVEPYRVERRGSNGSIGDPVRLLWYGIGGSPNAPSGMDGLAAILPVAERVARRRDFELVVASNDRAKYQRLLGAAAFATRYEAWTQETFGELLAQADAVVLPIAVNPFTACKSNNRLATALFHGAPVIADSIPSYREFAPYCYLDDWDGGLEAVAANSAELEERTRCGRDYVRTHYAIEPIARRWETVLADYVR